MALTGPPNPSAYASWNLWALELTAYLQTTALVDQNAQPQAVMLAHRTRDQLERASVDGIMMYDPVYKSPVFSNNGQWEPVIMDSRIHVAELEIAEEFGDSVSVASKAKTLLKFGNSLDLDVADGYATVWQLGQEAGAENEAYVASGSNGIDSISSTSATDSAEIAIEGHVSDGGVGDAEQFTFTTETVTLNGRTRVALANSYARISNASVVGNSPLAGDVYVYENTALTSGKPTDITKAHISVAGASGETQSAKAATTLSSQDYFIITNLIVSTTRNSLSSAVDFRLEVRRPGSMFRPTTATLSAAAGSTVSVSLDPAVIVPKNSDVRVVAATTADDSQVSAEFQGYLAEIVS